MKRNSIVESDLIEIIVYSCLAFLLMGVVLVLFFYFSRKKIVQKELEKKDLEIQHQKEQIRAVIITQEEERKRIAQDLHDDISSKLNIVTLNTHLLATPHLSEKEITEITENIISLTTKALDNSRKIAHGLLPPVFDKFGLHAGVEELCLEFSSSKSLVVSYENKVRFNDLDKDRHLHVFRILQELMNNSLRHGKATKIQLLFDEDKELHRCTYSDNGIGFDKNDKKNQTGLGMKNIQSRIAFINGTMTVDSAMDQGIKVIFNF
jgi:signal transduction histidine kinase